MIKSLSHASSLPPSLPPALASSLLAVMDPSALILSHHTRDGSTDSTPLLVLHQQVRKGRKGGRKEGREGGREGWIVLAYTRHGEAPGPSHSSSGAASAGKGGKGGREEGGEGGWSRAIDASSAHAFATNSFGTPDSSSSNHLCTLFLPPCLPPSLPPCPITNTATLLPPLRQQGGSPRRETTQEGAEGGREGGRAACHTCYPTLQT